jgi:hypothetical protein
MDGILKVHFDKFRDKGLLPPELCNNNHCEDMKLFNEPELMKSWRNNLKGIRWKIKMEIFIGAVDNILQKGKN